MLFQHRRRGFTVIEILIVITILLILFVLLFVAIRQVQRNARNVTIRNDVRQLRLLAEEVYDNQGASYTDWLANPLIIAQVATLRDDIDITLGDPAGTPWQSVIVDSREKEYCVSAPLANPSTGAYYCVDTSAQFVQTNAPCQAPVGDSQPLLCPTS